MSSYFAILGKNDYFTINSERIPLWEFLNPYLQPDGWLVSIFYKQAVIPQNQPLIFDCGAPSYKSLEIPVIRGVPVTAEWALAEYLARQPKPGSILISPDHLLLPGSNLNLRRQFNLKQAEKFLPLVQSLLPHVTPMAVVHGVTLSEKINRAQALYEFGYRALAIGGLVLTASNKSYNRYIVEAIKRTLPNDCYLHVLGLCSPIYARYWNELSIDSFDGSSYIQEAFLGRFYEANGIKLIRHPVALQGEAIAAPLCHCSVCYRLRIEGFDIRTSGNRQKSLGRVVHNLGQVLTAQKNAISCRRIALVASVGKKLDRAAAAKDLYCSHWWRAARCYVELSGFDEWFPLSARYGVLNPDREIHPYDESLKSKSVLQRQIWADMVVAQLQAIAPAGAEFVFIGGQRYREFVVPKLLSAGQYTVKVPLAGLGIGWQLHWLKKNTPQSRQLSLF